jgi:very-short-patch-repair endonuclease
MAALLACGPDAILSHDSAADVWGIRPAQDGPVHVTLAGGDARHPGIRVHRTPDVPAAARPRHAGLPLTTAARTLADLRLPAGEQARACEQAEILGLVPRTAGAPGITRSEAERRLLRLIRAAGLPAPRTNVRVGDYEVDCHWPDARLVVEVDGFAYHASRAAFERDRRRDADLVVAGLRVVRFTWRQLVHEPEAVVARLAVLLA